MAKGVREALTADEKLAWLRLMRSEHVGPVTFRSLLDHFGSAEAALAALPRLSRRGGSARSIRIASRAEAEEELEAAERIGAVFVAIDEPLYPMWLRHGDAPPPLVAVRGETQHLSQPSVAIVGARNASAAGRKMAALLAAGLGKAKFAIVSGLARGIDSAVHEAALSSGTIAVFAGGIDRVYPSENETLFQRILDSGGCAISEMRLGWEPRARDFPRRNRIIAGLALATVVVEAAERSGSLITARLALEQNREVFAVPGSPLDPRAAGSNRLIKQGARMATSVEDVLEAVLPILGTPRSVIQGHHSEPLMHEHDAEPGDGDRSRVLEALGPSPIEIDEIIRLAGLPARAVNVILLELDLAGRVERHAGQRISLR